MEHHQRISNGRSAARRIVVTSLLALALAMSDNLFAQTPDLLDAWSIGAGGNDRGMAIATASDGSVYSTGNFSGTVDFDRGIGTTTLTAGDTGDVFVAKHDASGNFVWAFRVGGVGPVQAASGAANSGVSIAVDAGDNVIVMGYFTGTADFDPNAGTTTRTARAGRYDMFVARYTAAGALLWVLSLPVDIELQYSKQHCLGIDGQGNIVVGGQFHGTVDFNPGPQTFNLSTFWNASNYGDAFVAKYTSAGVFVWAIRIGSSPDWETVQALAIDGNNNVHVAGIFGFSSRTTVNFNPWKGAKYNVTPPGRGSNYVAKYNASGQIQWAFALGNDSSLRTVAMDVDAASNVVITGYMQGTVDFNPSSTATAWVTPRILANMSIFMAKYDALGRYRWAFASAMGVGSSLAIESSGDVIVTGNYFCTGDFDPGSDSTLMSSVPGCHSNCFVARYTAAGALDWVFGIPGLDSSATYGKGMVLDGGGNVYVTGNLIDTADFDPSENTNNLASSGGWDVFIAKYGAPTLAKRTARVGSDGIILRVAPNPFTGELTLERSGAKAPARVEVSDMSGRVVEAIDVTAADDRVTLGAQLPKGAYIVQVIQGDGRRSVIVHKAR